MIVEVPGHGRIEFPDGMSEADIGAAIDSLGGGQQPTRSAADDTSMGEAALIAAGRGTDQVVKGVKQAWHTFRGNQPELDRMAAEEADNARLYAPLKSKFPVTTALGESAPSLAVPGGGSGLALLARGALAGGAPEALKYGSAQERLSRGAAGAAGGAIGAGIGAGLGRVLKPSSGPAVSGEAMEAAKRLGYQVTPGQATQNPAMMNFENYLLRSPGSSGRMQAVVEGNQAALNKAGARAMGESADNLSEGVFDAAKGRIGSEFTRLQGATNPQLGTDFMDALVKVDTANTAKASFARKDVGALVDKGLDLAAKGNLSGTAYKEIRTELNNAAQAAFRGGDATLGQAYKTIRDSLDDAAMASLPKADQEAWGAARKQWSAYKTLSKGNVAEAGNVSAARTAAAVRRDPRFRSGGIQGEMADIARIGEAFKGVQNPNSGNLTQQMVFGNPLTGIPMMAGNNLAARAYLSKPGQKYLTKGLLDVSESDRKALAEIGAAGGNAGLLDWLGSR